MISVVQPRDGDIELVQPGSHQSRERRRDRNATGLELDFACQLVASEVKRKDLALGDAAGRRAEARSEELDCVTGSRRPQRDRPAEQVCRPYERSIGMNGRDVALRFVSAWAVCKAPTVLGEIAQPPCYRRRRRRSREIRRDSAPSCPRRPSLEMPRVLAVR